MSRGRSRSIRPRSRSRSRGRDRRYQGGSRGRRGRSGQGRDGSRVRSCDDRDGYGYEHRGSSSWFFDSGSTRFPHGEFDKSGVFHEYENGREGDVHANPNKWETVSHRRRSRRSRSPVRSGDSRRKMDDNRWNNLDNWSTSIFVTNFPPGTTRKGLWDRCLAAGKVVDVFIAEKLSSIGKRYAFVRFSKGLDVSNAIYKIRNLWIGSYRLFADVPKFKRGSQTYSGNANGGTVNRNVPVRGDNKFSVGSKHVSWAGLVGGVKDARGAGVPPVDSGHGNGGVGSSSNDFSVNTKGVSGGNPLPVSGECVEVNMESLVPMDNFLGSRLLKVRDVKSMANLYHIAGQEGFFNVSFRYVGGWWVRVDCPTSDVCSKFSECSSFKSVFSDCLRVRSDFVVKERMVWLSISGLPLGAWSSEIFSGIASRWGRVCFVDNDLEEPLAVGKVCILTSELQRIDGSVSCKVGDVYFDVLVKEQQYWTPTFDSPYVSDSESSDEEGSVFEGVETGSNKEVCGVKGDGASELEKEDVKVNSDPFGIMDFLNREIPEVNKNYSLSLSVPPGFERIREPAVNGGGVNSRESGSVHGLEDDQNKRDVQVDGGAGFSKVVDSSSCGGDLHGEPGSGVKRGLDSGGSFMKSGSSKIPQSVSVLEQFARYIDFGVSLGLEMDGAKSDLQRCINRMSDQLVSR
ncbi:hypothetical protein SSX86_010710 [Deinandra increscens subsp. villosa]|uniref:RRM domain-containing protein n=1 Tax=Deinandra increscens subsp. villosa TaxID=3103831 RepID=A0AAP0D8H1_9ASTR